MKRRVGRGAWGVGLLLLTACGRTEWREADAKMNDAAQAARAAGFAPMSGPHNTFGAFTAGGSTTWRVHLEAHQSYFVAAACTAGCDTLDFSVQEPHGQTIASDTTAGPTPRLMLQAPEEGDYHVVFSYAPCKVDHCRWVAQVYSRTAR